MPAEPPPPPVAAVGDDSVDPCRSAFLELLAAHAEIAERVEDPDSPLDDLTRGEAYTWLAANLAFVGELFIWGDPRRPRFINSSGPLRKRNGDNPDAFYNGLVIDPSLTYRIRGQRGDGVYQSVTVYGGPRVGEQMTRVVGHLSNAALGIGPDGRFEVVLSPGSHQGATIRLEPDAWYVATRDYVPAWRTSRRTSWDVEVVGPKDRRRALTGPELAAKLRAATAWTRTQTLPRPLEVSNEIAEPYRVEAQTTGAAAFDAVYARGGFDLQSDQALVIEGRSPDCVFWNLCLWNRFLQTFNYDYERVSLNGFEALVDSDGSWTMVIADEDPGHPNWVSTAGHRQGIIWMRWFLPQEMPERPTCRLVSLSEARARFSSPRSDDVR